MSTAAPFEYRTADCWEAAVEALVTWGEEGKILAGGQSIVPMLNLRLAMPEALIDVNPIPTPEPALDGDALVGIPVSTLFADYLIPSAMDMPDVRVEVPESGEGAGPLNARGIGEPILWMTGVAP